MSLCDLQKYKGNTELWEANNCIVNDNLYPLSELRKQEKIHKQELHRWLCALRCFLACVMKRRFNTHCTLCTTLSLFLSLPLYIFI